MPPVDTKTRILDSAEHLFAQDGFHITSMRTITSTAEVNLASINYHFGNKESLLQAVIERRLLPLNKIRADEIKKVIAQAEDNSALPTAKALLQAFIDPTLKFRDSSTGARDFITLVGRSLNEPDETVRNCFLALIFPIFEQLRQALQSALPHLSQATLLIRLQFIMGTINQVMCMRNEPLFKNQTQANNNHYNDAMQQLLQFILAGVEAPE